MQTSTFCVNKRDWNRIEVQEERKNTQKTYYLCFVMMSWCWMCLFVLCAARAFVLLAHTRTTYCTKYICVKSWVQINDTIKLMCARPSLSIDFHRRCRIGELFDGISLLLAPHLCCPLVYVCEYISNRTGTHGANFVFVHNILHCHLTLFMYIIIYLSSLNDHFYWLVFI